MVTSKQRAKEEALSLICALREIAEDEKDKISYEWIMKMCKNYEDYYNREY